MSEDQIASLFAAIDKLTGMVGSLQQGQVGMKKDIDALNRDWDNRQYVVNNSLVLTGFAALIGAVSAVAVWFLSSVGVAA